MSAWDVFAANLYREWLLQDSYLALLVVANAEAVRWCRECWLKQIAWALADEATPDALEKVPN